MMILLLKIASVWTVLLAVQVTGWYLLCSFNKTAPTPERQVPLPAEKPKPKRPHRSCTAQPTAGKLPSNESPRQRVA